ncbi:MAG: deoxyribodipyrimidine photolyase, partial [Myxococcota bacterium]|nr:deoxyribodipyrimidine photolyase [Myxococcota bacterium]
MHPPSVPQIRVSQLNNVGPNPQGDYILYWMVAARRTHHHFALEHALSWSRKLNRPLLVFEPLRLGYRWASPRLHRFIIDGMRDNEANFAAAGISYYPYVEPQENDGRGLLRALCERAAVVITDEFPCFFIPRMIASAARRASVLFEQVDGNGILPLRGGGRVFTTAASFRRHLQKTLPAHLNHFPVADPLQLPAPAKGAQIPTEILARWPRATLSTSSVETLLQKLSLAHAVPATERGGSAAAIHQADLFFQRGLSRYHSDRNQIDASAASGLSAAIH